MKKTVSNAKISLSFVCAMLMVACFATAGYSDSFVDENVINAIQNYKLGQVSTPTVTDNAAEAAFEGDSFVDANVIEALKDFRFGETAAAQADSNVQAESVRVKGDSFVDAASLKQMEGFVFLKDCRANAGTISTQMGILSKN